MVTSRGWTRVALLRLALCYSVVPLRSAHKPKPYEDSKRMCQSNPRQVIILGYSEVKVRHSFHTLESSDIAPVLMADCIEEATIKAPALLETSTLPSIVTRVVTTCKWRACGILSGQDRTGQDKAGQGRTGQGRTRHDRTRQDKIGQDNAGQDKAGQDKIG